ncbi:5648_t:CDS:10 [Acaulospora morrowiae]|uniref:ATP-dependent 6-phosphofructokinase n=1 Tax=Acaulospora morrowiae TaxID=94023 RepID=A0A9N9DAD3_9GLOM|nr:5648_t:CDS:10 [Acaulospora morrowiae]
MSLVESISHITLTASCIKDFDQCIRFYNFLGFQTISQEDIPKPASAERPEASWEKESYLHLFGDKVKNGITLRIVLPNETAKKSIPHGESSLEPEDASITIVSKNLAGVESALKSNNIHFQKYTYTEAGLLTTNPSYELSRTEICARDPLNNPITFTNKPIPFGKTIYPVSPMLSSKPADPIDENITPLKSKGKRIGVLTSGGDAPGMNAAVRAIVRVAISRGCEAYAIFEGYEGLVQGGKMIRKFGWADVRGYLAIGGTLIGTARCKSFRERSGRLDAACNLVKNGIDALIVCGGDGSLTGADILRKEWPGLIEELIQNGKLTVEEADPYKHLTIVGLVGSIDNDMPSTDVTIGAVTSLHRICEAVDSISSTASSHSRAFVIEVMGRRCGWLALMAAISTGADFVFIPERPPSENWEAEMCDVIKRHRQLGKRRTIVIVAEGAIDRNLNPIKPDYIKELLIKKPLELDTRVTTLGHTQRGGRPCAYDRNLATIQGVEAVNAVLESTPDTPSPMIGVNENKITSEPLLRAVELTHQVAEAISKQDFRRAMELRDPEFADNYEAYRATTLVDSEEMLVPEYQRLRIGIMHIGAPAGGMNQATRAAVRFALNRGHVPIAIYNGFRGILQENIRELSWLDVDDWTSKGGSELGTNRTEPDIDLGMVAYQIQKQRFDALLIIGGFEAYDSVRELRDARDKYPAFCIPIVCIPATISNNVPGTDFSLGSDTSLNAIVDSCDAIKQSASASRRRVFVVEVHGGQCGYLAVLSGLAVGATSTYIPEEGVSLKTLLADVNHLRRRYGDDKKGTSSGRLILRNECVSKTYTTDVIAKIIETEGSGLFDSRTCVLGHIQQGGASSPLDRIRAIRLAVRCIDFIERQAFPSMSPHEKAGPKVYTNSEESASVIGIIGAQVVFSSVVDLLKETDKKNRKSKRAWWIHFKELVDLLSKWGYSEKEAQTEDLYEAIDKDVHI